MRNHRPDFIFAKDSKTYCVEVELSLKSKDRLERNIKENFLAYDVQIWVVGEGVPKVNKILEDNKIQYPNIEIVDMEGVKKYVSELK